MDSKILATTDEPPAPLHRNFWVPRFLIAGLVVAIGALVTILHGSLAG
jgi:hypothetical protein